MKKAKPKKKPTLDLTHPHLAKQWDEVLNGSLTPQVVTAGSHKVVWWRCSRNHTWKTKVYNRMKGSGCPYCANQLVWEGFNDLATTHPELCKEWNWAKNEGLTPQQVLAGGRKRVWWVCERGHEWLAQLANRSQGYGCPYCSGRKAIVGQTDLATTHPKISAQWDVSKNGALTPQDVSAGSNKKANWVCQQGHHWESRINERTSGKGCPICAGRQVLVGETDLATTHPEIAAQWDSSKNGDLTPQDVVAGSNKKVHWICEQGHPWSTMIMHRTNGSGCPYCTGTKVWTGFNDLAATHPGIASEWDEVKNGDLTPQQVSAGSGKRVWWKCRKGHTWRTQIYTRTSGTGCPDCTPSGTSFPEQCLFFYLLQVFPNCLNRTKVKCSAGDIEIDILIPELNLAIEYDGIYWHQSKLEKELKKNRLVQENYRFLRIREEGLSPMTGVHLLSSTYVTNGGIPPIADVFNFIVENLTLDAPRLQTIISLDIDVERDRLEILENYEQYERQTSLATLYPEIAKEWHKTFNGQLSPEYFRAHSSVKVWWTCSKGHHYQAQICNRTNGGQGCPYCSSRRVLSGFNDLATTHPEIAAQWDFSKNGDVTPQQISRGCGKKFWWRCSFGHSWHATPNARTTGTGCPDCYKNKFSN